MKLTDTQIRIIKAVVHDHNEKGAADEKRTRAEAEKRIRKSPNARRLIKAYDALTAEKHKIEKLINALGIYTHSGTTPDFDKKHKQPRWNDNSIIARISCASDAEGRKILAELGIKE